MNFEIWRNQILHEPKNISPLKFGMSQDEIIEIFGKPLILKYHDIELHFGTQACQALHLIYCDDEIDLCITAKPYK